MADLSPLMERIRAQFEARGDCFEFVVPEWGESPDRPLELIAEPLTLQDRDRVDRAMKEKGPFSGYAEIAILKLRVKATGAPAFTLADKPMLMRKADSRILQKIGDTLLHDVIELEAAAKNSASPSGS